MYPLKILHWNLKQKNHTILQNDLNLEKFLPVFICHGIAKSVYNAWNVANLLRPK